MRENTSGIEPGTSWRPMSEVPEGEYVTVLGFDGYVAVPTWRSAGGEWLSAHPFFPGAAMTWRPRLWVDLPEKFVCDGCGKADCGGHDDEN